MLITLTSAKGSPGVTTAALALALCWPRPVVLAELDPAGGDVLAGYGGGRASGNGLQELIVTSRRGGLAARLPMHLMALDADGRARLLPGLVEPATAANADWVSLAAALAGLSDAGVDVLADCGRLRAEHSPTAVLERAERTALVTRTSLRALHAARSGITELAAISGSGHLRARLGVVVIGAGEPYREGEIGPALGVPVFGTLPRDPRSAAVLSDGVPAGRLFAQSQLMRAARAFAADLAGPPVDGFGSVEVTGGGSGGEAADTGRVAHG